VIGENPTRVAERFDFLLQSDRFVIAIEIKWQMHEIKDYAKRLSSKLILVTDSFRLPTACVVVSPNCRLALHFRVKGGNLQC
jgi:hypothetical protein